MMLTSPPPDGRTKSIPDQIRMASGLLRTGVDNVLAIPRRYLRRPLSDEVDAPTVAQAVRWTLLQMEYASEAVPIHQEAFSAGYFELCRASQTIKPPSYWRQKIGNVALPSHHVLAANWLSDTVMTLQWEILDPSGELFEPPLYDNIDEDALFVTWQRKSEEIVGWAQTFADFPDDMLVILGLECVQALLLCERIPTSEFLDSSTDSTEVTATDEVAGSFQSVGANNFRISSDRARRVSLLSNLPSDVREMANLLAEDSQISERKASETVGKTKERARSLNTRFGRAKKRLIANDGG